MGYDAKVIADSTSKHGHRIITIQATFPRFILAEVNTHRVFSRNSASSRAIPVPRRIEQIESDPFVPLAFCKNQAGMQAGEALSDDNQLDARANWMDASKDAVRWAKRLVDCGVHKQWANRVIETYAWHTAVITATEWANHDGLRVHPAASPEYQTIAKMMQDARAASTPRFCDEGAWHLPYVQGDDGKLLDPADMDAAKEYVRKLFPQAEENIFEFDKQILRVMRKVSVGRCAAVSYERQELKDFFKDVDRYGKLHSSGHMSPFEHPARAMSDYEYHELFKQKKVVWNDEEECWNWVGFGKGGGENANNSEGDYWHFFGNVQGWVQDRKMVSNEHDFSKVGSS